MAQATDRDGIVHSDQTQVLATTTRTGHTVSRLISAWLGSFTASADTRAAYARDLREYVAWCTRRGLDPLEVRLPEVQMYATELAVTANPRTGRPYAASTSARKLAAISSWYTFLVRADAIDANPARDVSRPRYDRKHSPTASVTEEQATTMLAASRAGGHRILGAECAALVMVLLVDLGVRVSELCQANLTDLGQQAGMRILAVRMKGGTVRLRPLPAQASALLDEYLACRPDDGDPEALLVTRRGRRVSRHQIYRLVQRTAREAGVPMPERITPHSMRHAFNTIARQRGASLEDRRDALGHSSAAITQLYDHVALSVTRDPAHLVAAATGGNTPAAGHEEP
ncbi:integrase/recombinase XerD [Halopolyspora algeriensis]|uniref:Integrase/recombinase XerD n=1 Tax=Halopolyspora algeriensis TaxID=1500506 RepID=A0A368VVI5_9ACTN|nr:tyrosine-type recombinase/integrase [Halopolyspora algeriensis]RCW46106.1 integrase/recombinase XerD [Halopolyspora algeriensis]TQM55509.1 integrase/recombinase XerD [Halopolyspora algeriensis]